MTTAGPWSVKGIDPRARELAKDLARRSGMTLGEWLNQMIIEGDAEDEADEAPPPPTQRSLRDIRLSSDAELKRIARALDALTTRMEAAEHRSTLAISGIDQSVMGVLSRIEGVERDRNAVAARFDNELDEVKAAQSKVGERLRRLAEDEAPKLEAMRALEGALGKIAEKLYDTDARTKAAMDDVRQDIDHAVRRVDRVESRIETGPASALVEAVVARLGERMVEAESKTAEAMRALEVSFAGLDQRIKATETQGEEQSRFEKLAAELQEKVEANRTEITERLNAAAEGKLDRMEATLRDLTGHVEQGERRSAQAIDRMGREVMRIAHTLGDRVASVEARSAEAAQQMGGEMARIADAMEGRIGRADQIQAEALEKLGGEIARIAERLADRIANSERRAAAAIDDVGEQIGRVTDRLNDRHEASNSVLGERIRASEERTAKLLEEAREAIDRRLIEAQRRAALEDVAAGPAGERESAGLAPRPFAEGPFGPLDPPAAPLASASRAAIEEPFARFDGGYGDFDTDEAEAEIFAPAAVVAAETAPPEPVSTREVVAAARAAARAASERAEPAPRPRREALSRPIPDLAGSIAAPALDEDKAGGFSFNPLRRKKKEPAVTLRTMMVASGTAAALAVTAVGATLYLGAEAGHDRVDRSSPPPTAARRDDAKPLLAAATTTPPAADGASGTDPNGADAGKADTLAVALAPAPGETTGLKPPAAPGKAGLKPAPPLTTTATAAPTEARPLYNLAIGRLQAGDVSGVADLTKAANLGFAPAQFYLAKLYEQGGSGIKKDLVEARRWTERAAEAGDPRAMHNLALYAFNGEGGAKDQAEATRWFKKAAEEGVVDSQYNLARLYENGGYGVQQNKAEAYKWYLIAANEGDKDAKASADTLKAQLAPEQASTAERSALAFHAVKSTLQAARTP